MPKIFFLSKTTYGVYSILRFSYHLINYKIKNIDLRTKRFPSKLKVRSKYRSVHDETIPRATSALLQMKVYHVTSMRNRSVDVTNVRSVSSLHTQPQKNTGKSACAWLTILYYSSSLCLCFGTVVFTHSRSSTRQPSNTTVFCNLKEEKRISSLYLFCQLFTDGKMKTKNKTKKTTA
jgi:hypothetical protein